MSKLYTKTAASKLTTSEIGVLDHLLENFPCYAMVDNFRAVTKLLEEDLIEADVRMDGEVAQAVYRVTKRGAEAYRLSQPVRTFERVG